MNINYRINKNDMVSLFKSYTDSHTDKEDNYRSKGKEVQYRSEYITLEKVKSIYNFIIDNIKLSIRKEFIHDDEAYKNIINKLIDRVNNKIRTTSNGDLYINVGTNDPVKFSGSDDQYKALIIYNKNKQAQVVRRVVDELNAVLDNNPPEEEGKVLINSSKLMYKSFESLEPVHIVNKLFEKINKKIISEIFKGNFSNFDIEYFKLIREENIDLESAKRALENIHTIFIDSEKPIRMFLDKINEADDAPKQIYKRFSDPGLENRREKSMDVLKGRGLTAKGGGWHNKRGELVATIGDKGEIQWKNTTLSKPPAGGLSQGLSSAGKSIEQGFAQQQPISEPEIETGLSNDELEYIRKFNEG